MRLPEAVGGFPDAWLTCCLTGEAWPARAASPMVLGFHSYCPCQAAMCVEPDRHGKCLHASSIYSK
jgi:hypothetical protein